MRRTVLLIAMGVVGGFSLVPSGVRYVLDSTIGSCAAVLDTNHKIFDVQSMAADQLRENTDIILRIAHYVSDHPAGKTVILCPVCGELEAARRNLSPPPNSEPVDEPDGSRLPATMAQLQSDSLEIGRNAGRVLFSLALQRDSLRFFLRKLELDATPQGGDVSGHGQSIASE